MSILKKLFFLLLVANSVELSAQQQYITENNIHYYSDSINKSDEYINSQCVLDFYYPKDVNGFSTIVWFHGGGMTGGKKQGRTKK